MPNKDPTIHRAQCNAAAARYRANHPDRTSLSWKKHRLKKLYGLTPEEVLARVDAQGGCAACGAKKPGHKFGWQVDHNHTTGAVRGILCHHCNVTLGHAKDSIERLLQLVRYLGVQ